MEKLFRKFRKGEKVEAKKEVVNRVWKKPDRTLAKNLPVGALVVVHGEDETKSENPEICWLRIEEINKTPDGKVSVIGRIHGPQNAIKREIDGDTSVHCI